LDAGRLGSQDAGRLRCGDGIIIEGRAFNEIINYHLNFAGVGLFAISYEPSTGTLVPHLQSLPASHLSSFNSKVTYQPGNDIEPYKSFYFIR
jgi:hypothetical protein